MSELEIHVLLLEAHTGLKYKLKWYGNGINLAPIGFRLCLYDKNHDDFRYKNNDPTTNSTRNLIEGTNWPTTHQTHNRLKRKQQHKNRYCMAHMQTMYIRYKYS